MYSQYFQSRISQKMPKSCIIDTTLPTFSGLTSVAAKTDGTFDLEWAAGSTAGKDPIRYLVYGVEGEKTASDVFQNSNLIQIVQTTNAKVLTLADQQTYFIKGKKYTFGVRAVDALGYMDNNNVVVNQTCLVSGNLPDSLQALADSLRKTSYYLMANA